MKILDLVQNTPEWEQSRKESFNASETPALFGINPFTPKNPLELAHLKYGDLIIPQNKAMKAGSENEAWIREYIEKEVGIPFEPLVAAWEEDERFRASFDGISFDGDIVLEIKYSKHTFEMLKNGEIPSNYYLQMQHQLLVSGACEAIFAVANPDTKEVIIKDDIKRDYEIVEEIIKKWIEFEKEFKNKKLPPLEVERKDIEWEFAVTAYKAAEQHYKEAKAAYEEAKQTLIELSEGVKTKGFGITVIPVKSTRYEYAKAKEYIPPDVLEKIKKESVTYRIQKEKQ